MKHALKLAAAVGLSLPVLFGGVASAAPAESNAVVTPAAEDSPLMVLIGQLVISGNEASGNADSNQ
jgi:hypothetical protein